MSTKNSRAAKKALLLSANDDEEVDEPIANGENGATLLLAADEEEEEEDEPLISSNGAMAVDDNDANDKNVLLGNDEEEDEVDEPLALSVPTSTEIVTANTLQNCSTECSEALTAIASDCWDISSWIIYYEEVQQGRAGNITVVEAHERIIAQFPRSARFWKNLAEYHLHRGENDIAEETFRKCLSKCRSIDLWKSYLSYLFNAFIDTMRLNMPLEQHSKVRAKCESAFEEAVENVGLALGSFPLWRSYIDFVKSWPEAGMIESGKKLHMLRHVYQRAVGVAMEQSDEIWTEYETFEKSNGEQSAELVLPEFNRKYLHAKSVAKDRRKLTQSIVFDRLATPPTNSQSELQQLEYWSLWISYEMSGPDYLNPESFVPMVRMVYEQCLCCFRFNPEVWISAAHFEQDPSQRRADSSSGGGLSTQAGAAAPETAEAQEAMQSGARAVLIEAIETNPGVTLLRCALAELEEGAGKMEAAKEVLRVTFEQNPSGFSFALFQRFIRRNLGITAARRLFSETQAMRKGNAKLALELSLANAKLELEVNCAPQIALNVLNMAQRSNPLCLKDSLFIRTISRVLTLLGDLKQLRWIFQSALSEFSTEATLAASAINSKTAQGGRNGHNNSRNRNQITGNAAGAGNHAQLKAELELWEEYLTAETTLGLSDIARLNELRARRDKVKVAFEEAERFRLGIVFNNKEEARAAQRGIFHPAQDLSDRYDGGGGSAVWTLPESDRAVQERCGLVLGTSNYSAAGGATRKNTHDRNSNLPAGALAALAGRTRGSAGDREVLNMSTEFHLSLAGLPAILRDLLAKLPFHSGPLPDVDGFVRHVKSVILPPRPEPEESSAEELEVAVLGEDGDAQGVPSGAPSWLGKHAVDDADVDADDTADTLTGGARGNGTSAVSKDEDVFRMRKRIRKA